LAAVSAPIRIGWLPNRSKIEIPTQQACRAGHFLLTGERIRLASTANWSGDKLHYSSGSGLQGRIEISYQQEDEEEPSRAMAELLKTVRGIAQKATQTCLTGIGISCTCTVHEKIQKGGFIMAGTAVERIVVQATPQEKKAIMLKAKKLGLPVAELMRRGATAYEPAEAGEELGILADKAKAAADRASDSIDDALAFVESSNKRIAAMEAKAAQEIKTAV
jgi:hypothetical protein